jgi:hypothetical protein
MKTIGVDLWGGQARGLDQNRMTCVRPATMPVVQRNLRELFVHAYPRFAATCRAVDEPGVALVAIHEATGRAMGLVQLRARVDRHVAAIIGRHDQCDLFLDASDRLALRHLAIILDPVTSWQPRNTSVRYRVLDLRTAEGFKDEEGRTLRGVRCEGPAFLRFGGHVLFALPLGDSSDWPTSADDAWSYLPERVYFDELDHDPQGSLPHLPPPRADLRRSFIMRTHGPRDTGVGLVNNGDVAGTLELFGVGFRGVIQVGPQALRDGILVGRYARCDGAHLADDPSLSRVHALLIQIDDAIIMVDTSSRNGTREADKGDRARVIAMAQETDLLLGKRTRARWRWLS